jgi:hypothetical protein
MIKVRDIVFEILKVNISSRDENTYLYFFYLKRMGIEPSTLSTMELLKKIRNKELKSFDSISRASRLVQENYPYLRGKFWDKRQGKSKEVKKEIIDMKNGRGYTP